MSLCRIPGEDQRRVYLLGIEHLLGVGATGDVEIPLSGVTRAMERVEWLEKKVMDGQMEAKNENVYNSLALLSESG